MKLMQRLGANLTPEYVDDYVKAATKYQGACDNVWLATMYGYPPKKTHQELAAYHETVAARFREKGVSVSLQLSNTFGHGECQFYSPCGRKQGRPRSKGAYPRACQPELQARQRQQGELLGILLALTRRIFSCLHSAINMRAWC